MDSRYEPSLLHSFASWLDSHAWSTALHESLWVWPLVESTHVLTVALFVGVLVMVDLRLLGFAFKDTRVSTMTSRVLPWSIAGFCVMVVSGLLLFYSNPVDYVHNVWFRAKVILLVVAAVNAWTFHRRVSQDRERWDSQPKPPLSVRLVAATSVSVWAGVILTGRMIAYNWFNCGGEQSPFILWAAGCAVELTP